MWRRYNSAYGCTADQLKQDGAVIDNEETGRIVAVGERHTIATEYPSQHWARERGTDQPFLHRGDQALYPITPHLAPQAPYLDSKRAVIEMLPSGMATPAEFFYIHGSGLDNSRPSSYPRITRECGGYWHAPFAIGRERLPPIEAASTRPSNEVAEVLARMGPHVRRSLGWDPRRSPPISYCGRPLR